MTPDIGNPKPVTLVRIVVARKNAVQPSNRFAEISPNRTMKPDAIAAYQKSRSLMPDTTIDKRIDEYIKELKD